jgi:hypothetical protein
MKLSVNIFHFIAVILLLCPLRAQANPQVRYPQVDSVPPLHSRALQVSFVPYFGTTRFFADPIGYDVSINILAGSVYEVRSFEAGSLLNFVSRDCNGFEVAGIGNFVGRNVHGFQCAGIVNKSMALEGVQTAGIVNYSGKARGLQVAGLINQADSGRPNQISGLVNNAGEGAGFQVTGLINHTIGGTGFQISGLVNHAHYVKHLQIGVVNIADSTGGIPIGVFNFIKNGVHQLEISGDEMFYLNVAYRSGVRQFHSIVTTGIDFTNLVLPLWTYGAGLGSTSAISAKTAVDFDILFQNVVKGGYVNNNYLYKINLGLTWQFSAKNSLYMGVSYNFLVTDLHQRHYPDAYSDIAPYSFKNREISHYSLRQWMGFKAAIRFF